MREALGSRLRLIAVVVAGALLSGCIQLITTESEAPPEDAAYSAMAKGWKEQKLVDYAQISQNNVCVRDGGTAGKECHVVLWVQADVPLNVASDRAKGDVLSARLADDVQRLIENEEAILVSMKGGGKGLL